MPFHKIRYLIVKLITLIEVHLCFVFFAYSILLCTLTLIQEGFKNLDQIFDTFCVNIYCVASYCSVLSI